MFVTPVFYSLSAVKSDIQWIVSLNPLTPLFELFRLSLLGSGTLAGSHLVYSIGFILVSLCMALFLFNRKGTELIDVV